MTNSEWRCASTTLEAPDFQAEVRDEVRRSARLVGLNQLDNAARVFGEARIGLISGRFPTPVAALEFVFDEIL